MIHTHDHADRDFLRTKDTLTLRTMFDRTSSAIDELTTQQEAINDVLAEREKAHTIVSRSDGFNGEVTESKVYCRCGTELVGHDQDDVNRIHANHVTGSR
jgi:hypothetical protein